jgi:hypothetical protein
VSSPFYAIDFGSRSSFVVPRRFHLLTSSPSFSTLAPGPTNLSLHCLNASVQRAGTAASAGCPIYRPPSLPDRASFPAALGNNNQVIVLEVYSCAETLPCALIVLSASTSTAPYASIFVGSPIPPFAIALAMNGVITTSWNSIYYIIYF